MMTPEVMDNEFAIHSSSVLLNARIEIQNGNTISRDDVSVLIMLIDCLRAEVERLQRARGELMDAAAQLARVRDNLRLAMTEAYWIINYPTDSKEHHDRRKNWIHEHADDYLEVTQRDGLNSRSWLKEEK